MPVPRSVAQSGPSFPFAQETDGQNSLLNITGKSVRLSLTGIELFTARPLINPNK